MRGRFYIVCLAAGLILTLSPLLFPKTEWIAGQALAFNLDGMKERMKAQSEAIKRKADESERKADESEAVARIYEKAVSGGFK